MRLRSAQLLLLAETVGRLLDALDHAALVFDAHGTLLYETRAWNALVARGANPLSLRREAHQAALGRVKPPTAGERFALRRLAVAPAGGEPSERTDVVVVLAEVRSGSGDVDEVLRHRYGLTPRETTVAHLIADGLSTPQVATALGVSVHTARRHGERIFRKLGVRTRAAVTARVIAAVSATGGSPVGGAGAGKDASGA